MACPCRRGACGFVQLAKDTVTGEPVAVKFISRTKGFNAQTAGRELLNQRACAGHSHVVQLQVGCLHTDSCVMSLSCRRFGHSYTFHKCCACNICCAEVWPNTASYRRCF
jgi:hypothetical protein